MAIQLTIEGETGAEVMGKVREFARCGLVDESDMGVKPDQPEPDPEPVPEPEPEPEQQKQPAKKAPAKKKSEPEPEPELEPEPAKEVTFEDLTAAATKFIESLEGDMRKAQDAVQEQFGVRKIGQLEHEQWATAYQWLKDQVGDR